MKGLKKNTFIGGTIVATMGIIISKIIGVLYVIPFYDMIGDQGGALYGYAYMIYNIFLGISTIGLPFAMSKIISEYHTLGYENTKERAFKVGKKIMWLTGIVAFLILFIFAEPFAYAIVGDLTGGNSLEDVTTVIRIVSTALILVPIMSIQRGYLQGHKFITPSSVSQVLEQIARVAVILLGSYLGLKVFNLSLTTVVGISVFAATVSAFVAFLYLLDKIRKNKSKLVVAAEMKDEEKKITNKDIAKKLLMYAVPFISISIISSLYDMVNLFTVNKTLVSGLGYSMSDSELIMGVYTTWGYKLNSIITSISMGLTVSLVPNITSSYVLKDNKDLKYKINQAIQIIIFIALPFTVLMSAISLPLWNIFYGSNELAVLVFSHSVYTALFLSFFTTAINIVQAVNSYKWVFISLVSGLLVKVLTNVALMNVFNVLGFDASYGITVSTCLGYLTSTVIGLIYLSKRFKFNYYKTARVMFNSLFGILLMLISIYLLQLVIPLKIESRVLSFVVCGVYSIVALGIYFGVGYKNKTFVTVLGENTAGKLTKIFKRKKK